MTGQQQDLIVQSNKLINARYELSLLEKRLILLMLRDIRREDEDLKTYRIRIRSLCEGVETNAKNMYTQTREATRKLLTRVIEIHEPDGLLQVSPISRAKYYKGKGYVELTFDPRLKPYLLQLKRHFTQYTLKNVLGLQSIHSIRIYELLKQYEGVGKRTVEVEELKRLLGVDKRYKRYSDFKKRVILQAEGDLAEQCDIRFRYEEVKRGRKVAAIVFYISPNGQERNGPPPTVVLEADTAAEEGRLLGTLCEWGLSKDQATFYVRERGFAFCGAWVEEVKARYAAGKVEDVGAYLRQCLESGNVPKAPAQEKAEEAKGRQRAKKAEEEAEIDSLLQAYAPVYEEQVGELMRTAGPEAQRDLRERLGRDEILRAWIAPGGRVDEERFGQYLREELVQREGLDFNRLFAEWVHVEKGLAVRYDERRRSWRVLN